MKTYCAVIKDSKNELTHWKYIRREKKNGKWRYYYEKDNLRLNVGKTEKYNPTFDFYGAKVPAYLIKSRETNDKYMSVDKKPTIEQELVISYM